MQTTIRKPFNEPIYEYRRMSVGEYMRHCANDGKPIAESTVRYRLKKVDEGVIPRDILDYEQLAPGYPITLIVRVKVPRGTIR